MNTMLKNLIRPGMIFIPFVLGALFPDVGKLSFLIRWLLIVMFYMVCLQIKIRNLKPQKSFAEWAKEHDVELTPVNLQPGGAAYGRHEENANGSSKIVVRRTISAVIASSVIVAILVSLIAVSVTMLPNNDVKHYQQSDTVSVLSSLDEAADYPGMLLFDTSSLYQMTSVFRQVAKDDESVTLAYIFSAISGTIWILRAPNMKSIPGSVRISCPPLF